MRLKRVLDQLSKAEMALSELSLAVICIIVALQVFFRYFLRNPFIWVDELSSFLLVWIIFLGSSIAFKKGRHAGVTYFRDKLPDRIKNTVVLMINILLGFFFMILGYETLRYMIVQSNVHTAALRLPRSLFSLPLLWFIISALLSLVLDTISVGKNIVQAHEIVRR